MRISLITGCLMAIVWVIWVVVEIVSSIWDPRLDWNGNVLDTPRTSEGCTEEVDVKESK